MMKAILSARGWGVIVWLRRRAAGSLDDDALVITPPGFSRPGVAQDGAGTGVRAAQDHRSRPRDQPVTPCRINVVGPDGDFYQPAQNRLSPYSLTGPVARDGQRKSPGQGADFVISAGFFTRPARDRGRRSRRARARRGLEGIRVPADRARRHGRAPARPSPCHLELERTTSDGGAGLLLGRPRTCTSRARTRPTIKRSSTCSRPRTSSSARSWLTTSPPVRTPA